MLTPVVGWNRQILLVDQAHMISTAITRGPVMKGTLEENDSEAEIGNAGKVSPCKVNEGSEDMHELEKVQLE